MEPGADHTCLTDRKCTAASRCTLQDPQRRQSRRHPGRAAGKIRARHQPEDRRGARDQDPAAQRDASLLISHIILTYSNDTTSSLTPAEEAVRRSEMTKKQAPTEGISSQPRRNGDVDGRILAAKTAGGPASASLKLRCRLPAGCRRPTGIRL